MSWRGLNMINWFKRGPSLKEQIATLEAKLQVEYETNDAHKNEISKLEDVLCQTDKELNELKEANKLVDHKTSIIPWMEIVCEGIDPIKGAIISMDWNEAFTQYLKDSGLNTKDEEAAIQGWLLFMYQDQIEKLEQRVIDNKDRNQNNDYL